MPAVTGSANSIAWPEVRHVSQVRDHGGGGQSGGEGAGAKIVSLP